MSKALFREALKKIRSAISPKRRFEASSSLLEFAKKLAASHTLILLFASFQNEIDTQAVNHYLAHKKMLALPRIENGSLSFYKVVDFEMETALNGWGIYEPKSDLCEKIPSHAITTILIPGLGFDRGRHRLGYGKGHYDRFLKMVPHAFSIGIGFQEQYLDQLPTEPHDAPLTQLALF